MPEGTYIHSTANVARNSNIGPGTKVWVNVQIREQSTIGSHCILSKDVYIDAEVSIGDRCKVQNSVSVYRGVTLADDVFVGPNASFTNDRVPRAFNDQWEIVPTLVERGASIGANATVICGITLGEYCIVAAGSVVTRDVEPYALVAGNPARFLYYVDRLGNKVDEKTS